MRGDFRHSEKIVVNAVSVVIASRSAWYVSHGGTMLCWPRGDHHGHVEWYGERKMKLPTSSLGELVASSIIMSCALSPKKFRPGVTDHLPHAFRELSHTTTQVSGLNFPRFCRIAWTFFRSSSNCLTSSACSAFFLSRNWKR